MGELIAQLETLTDKIEKRNKEMLREIREYYEALAMQTRDVLAELESGEKSNVYRSR